MTSFDILFQKSIPGLGRFAVRPLRIPADIPVIHDWVSRDYAVYWGMQGKSVEEVERAYREIVAPEHAGAYIGLHDGRPAFLMECYQPIHDPIGRHYDARPDDRGMHILVAPAERPIHGYTWHVFTVVMDFLFSDASVWRIVVEPNVRNDKIHALNRRAGFQYQKTVDLPATATQPAKTAYLSFCTREQYAEALAREGARS
jgi:RimJ/RimL family protein N-acetyltransferase